MSKLVNLLKYESMWDVLPGAGRTLWELATFGKCQANLEKDYTDFFRSLMRVPLTFLEIQRLATKVPNLILDERYHTAAIKVIAILAGWEGIKFLADGGLYHGLRRVLRNESQTHTETSD